MASTDPLIELQKADVMSSYTGAVVLEAVDWQIKPGEFWIVGGTYGSGKTDLLSTAAGLQRPKSGSLLLFGDDVARVNEPESARLRQRVGLVFKHGGRMFANFTVLENVELGVRYQENLGAAEAAEKVEQVLDEIGLTQYATRIASSLGPNLKHRVGVARALALRPEVLLLDEPLMGMDTPAQRWLIEFLTNALKSSQIKAVVVGTIHFEPWMQIGTHFAVLKNKRWLAFDNRDALKDAMLETSATEV
jgi:ABC-type transporter Mla maintaining outer membrane lipid asymmetry ATPase subunit MlaF